MTALLASTAIPFGAATMPAQESLSKDQAFKVLKDVGNAEVALFASKGQGYGDLSEVVRSSDWVDPHSVTRDLNIPVKAVDATSAAILDYTLRIIRSDDKQHFEASLTPTKMGCGTAWFLDERSVAWVGKPLDC